MNIRVHMIIYDLIAIVALTITCGNKRLHITIMRKYSGRYHVY